VVVIRSNRSRRSTGSIRSPPTGADRVGVQGLGQRHGLLDGDHIGGERAVRQHTCGPLVDTSTLAMAGQGKGVGVLAPELLDGLDHRCPVLIHPDGIPAIRLPQSALDLHRLCERLPGRRVPPTASVISGQHIDTRSGFVVSTAG
jgi:hypothetical protein